MTARSGPAGPLWAVTCFYNPGRYARRRATYRVFRSRLSIPLVAVELAYGDDFELTPDDAEILIQLRSRDVLWQKERLLNVVLKALPTECRVVAWLDCDIVFSREDWPGVAAAALARVPVAQLFSYVHRLPKDALPESGIAAERIFPSFAAMLATGRPASDCLDISVVQRWTTIGIAWAARRDLLEEHGLYDGCIIGGGDRAHACGLSGCFDNIIRIQSMNSRRQEHFLAWAEPYYAATRGEVGYVDGDVFHLWHGTYENRRMGNRQECLTTYNFDPFTDIALAENGSWRWNSDKPELHEYLRNYFLARQEDG